MLSCSLFFPLETKGELHGRERHKEKTCRNELAGRFSVWLSGGIPGNRGAVRKDPSEDGLRQESTYDNAVNGELKEVHRMVEIVKFDAETTISSVRLTEKLERSRREGEARGEVRGEARGKEPSEAGHASLQEEETGSVAGEDSGRSGGGRLCHQADL